MGTEDMGKKSPRLDSEQVKFLIGVLKPFNIIWEENRFKVPERKEAEGAQLTCL